MKSFSEITPEIQFLAEKSRSASRITSIMYDHYKVQRVLRDEHGDGVVTGLTEISTIVAKERLSTGDTIPCHGRLYYRGVNIRDLTAGFLNENRFGFDEAIYLLLFSQLPNARELKSFSSMMAGYRCLPPSFEEDILLKSPSGSVMNMIARSVLALYAYDEQPDDISTENVLRQCLQLIAAFPLLVVNAYRSCQSHKGEKVLPLREPDPALSTAENLLYMLREDGKYTATEARLLDLALVLHAEHGGGNNSTFTTHVVTSTGTDTYSALAAALCSLKGPRHGGANTNVLNMMDDMKSTINIRSKDSIREHLIRLLERQAFDRSGMIYGMGHPVYSFSDPRAEVLKTAARQLAREKGMDDDYNLYVNVAGMASQLIEEKRNIYKGVSANIDFYSGMVYNMLGLPRELMMPIFASARIVGWSAHRMEELENSARVIRPSYIGVKREEPYVPMNER